MLFYMFYKSSKIGPLRLKWVQVGLKSEEVYLDFQTTIFEVYIKIQKLHCLQWDSNLQP